jgi:hypothetical protein
VNTRSRLSALEAAARKAWWEWGNYAKWTICDSCCEPAHCVAARRRGPFLCLGCFDQDEP